MATKTVTAPTINGAGPVRAHRKADAPTPESVEPMENRETPEIDSGKRRMPDNLRKYLLKVQGGKFYLPAAYRIVWFRDECPDWGVETILLEGGTEAGFATVQAKIYNAEGRLIASGIKTETRQDFPAGWVEKAETGSIARALAVAGFGTQFTPELDDDGTRPADSPQPFGGVRPRVAFEGGRDVTTSLREERPTPRAASEPLSETWEGPGQCPKCHAPEGKRHGRQCLGG
jgi:hypothetical protein